MVIGIALTALLGLTVSDACAAPVFVSAAGSDLTGDGSADNPYALSSTRYSGQPGGINRVGPGIFDGSFEMREAVSLIGAGPNKTTISGAGGYGVAVIDASYMDSDTTISGFTIAPADSCTAIHCTNVDSLVITGNIISGFTAAAIRCDDA